MTEMVMNSGYALEAHGFYYDEDRNLITLDVIPRTRVINDADFAHAITNLLQQQWPDYNFSIVVDPNYTEEK